MNGSKGPKTESSRSSVIDPLDAAREDLGQSKEATKLLEYSDDFDELTGKTEVTVNLQNPQPQPSQPNIEVTQDKPGVLRIVFTVVQKFPAWGAVIVALAAIAAYVVLKLRGAL